MRETSYVIEGRRWLPIARAAKLLRTNAQAIRRLMGEGRLDWRQTRANSTKFAVAEDEVMKLRAELPDSAFLKKRKPKRPAPSEPPRRVRGDLWEGHHLRLTLPAIDDIEKKKADPGPSPG